MAHINLASKEAITTFQDMHPGDIERISHRVPKPIAITEPKASWPADFAVVEAKVRAALPAGSALVAVEHVGSTSVPGLPAKDIIDVDVLVTDPAAEDTYVPALEAAGFQFLYRDPKWYEHRFFSLAEPYTNLHILAPDCPAAIRDCIFRDYLKGNKADRMLYADVKRQAVAASQEAGETTIWQYNSRKELVLKEIFNRAFKANGLLD